MTGFEFFLFGLLKAALTGAVAGAVIALVCLHWSQICAWFQSRIALMKTNPNNLGFSIQERLASGQYKTVYGIFNGKTNNLLACEAVDSDAIDQELAKIHRTSSLVVFPS